MRSLTSVFFLCNQIPHFYFLFCSILFSLGRIIIGELFLTELTNSKGFALLCPCFHKGKWKSHYAANYNNKYEWLKFIQNLQENRLRGRAGEMEGILPEVYGSSTKFKVAGRTVTGWEQSRELRKIRIRYWMFSCQEMKAKKFPWEKLLEKFQALRALTRHINFAKHQKSKRTPPRSKRKNESEPRVNFAGSYFRLTAFCGLHICHRGFWG